MLCLAQIGAFHLRQMLAAQGLSADEAGSKAQHILGAFLEAPPMPDAGPALEQLHAAGTKVSLLATRINACHHKLDLHGPIQARPMPDAGPALQQRHAAGIKVGLSATDEFSIRPDRACLEAEPVCGNTSSPACDTCCATSDASSAYCGSEESA